MGRTAKEFKDVVPDPQALVKLSYRPKDAAVVLGVSKSTVYELISTGRLEARKLGGATIIRHEALLRMLDGSPLSDATKAAQASIR